MCPTAAPVSTPETPEQSFASTQSSDTSSRGSSDLPAWFIVGLWLSLVWTGTAAVLALLLLWIGWYTPATCFVSATALALLSLTFRPRTGPVAPATHVSAAVALATVAVFVVVSGSFHSEHLFTDRDPAAYVNSGRSIARTHELEPRLMSGPFNDRSRFAETAAGFDVQRGRLAPNFLHLVSATLALGWAVGDDTGLLLVPAVLGALGLLALYAFASSVLGPGWALLAVAVTVAMPLQSWFARDAYSELIVQAFALGALWLFVHAYRGAQIGVAVVAGALLGFTSLARVDALTLLIGLPVALAALYLLSRADSSPPRQKLVIAAFALTLTVGVLVGYAASRSLSRLYFAILWDEYRAQVLAIALSCAFATVLVAAVRTLPGAARRVAHSTIVFGTMVGVLLCVAAWAYFWRPEALADRPVLPAKPFIPVEYRDVWNAWHFSASFRWFAWYLGISGLVLAVIGIALFARRALSGSAAAIVLLAVMVPPAIIYVARPSISPDHYWAMRRYLPIVLPGLAIAVSAAVAAAVGVLHRRHRALGLLGIVVGTVVALVPGLKTTQPVFEARIQDGALGNVHRLCDAVGDDGAVAVMQTTYLDATLPQTVRSFCGVPAASVLELKDPPLNSYAREWKSHGRRLFAASANPELVLAAAPDARIVAHLLTKASFDPERSTSGPPDAYAPVPVEIWLLEIPPG
jgi:hypothetical protein